MNYCGNEKSIKSLVSVTLLCNCFWVIPSLAQTASSEIEEAKTNLALSADNPLSLKEVTQLTLENSSSILQGRLATKIAQAGYFMERGVFNIVTSMTTRVSKSKQTGSTDEVFSIITFLGADFDRQNLNGTLTKRFRSGIQSSLTAGADHRDFDNSKTLVGTKPLNLTSVKLNVTFPLLKGRGYASAAANETAAQQRSEAAEFNFYHEVSQILQAAINAYWDYEIAATKARIHQESEKMLREWNEEAAKAALKQEGSRENIRKKYAAEISYFNGYVEDKQRDLAQAKEQIDTAKGNLAVAMGVPADQLEKIGPPSEDFPEEWQDVFAKLEQHPMQEKWRETALDNRFDLRSFQLQQEAAKTQLIKARQDILPQLDADLGYSLNSYQFNDDEHYSFTHDAKRKDLSASLNFSYPLGNDFAKGQRDLFNANYQIKTSQTNNLTREIQLKINTSAISLMNRMKILLKSRQALEAYQPLMDKLKQAHQSIADNPAAIIDFVEIEDRLNEAGLNYVDAVFELAKAITELRFQTGTLIARDSAGEGEIVLENLTTLPDMLN